MATWVLWHIALDKTLINVISCWGLARGLCVTGKRFSFSLQLNIVHFHKHKDGAFYQRASSRNLIRESLFVLHTKALKVLLIIDMALCSYQWLDLVLLV